jgi:hypothetical protein
MLHCSLTCRADARHGAKVPILLQKSIFGLIERMTDRIACRIDGSLGNLCSPTNPSRNRILQSLSQTSSKRLLQQNLPIADASASSLASRRSSRASPCTRCGTSSNVSAMAPGRCATSVSRPPTWRLSPHHHGLAAVEIGPTGHGLVAVWALTSAWRHGRRIVVADVRDIATQGEDTNGKLAKAVPVRGRS